MYNSNQRPYSRNPGRSFGRGTGYGRSRFGGGSNRFGRGGSYGGQRSTGGARRTFGKYINPALFVNKAQPVISIEQSEPTHQFTDFGLDAKLFANVQKKGYTKPTPIQDKAIKPILEKRDVLGIANTGTGKTAAFSIPLIQNMIKSGFTEHALIVAPTRELALQIRDEIRSLTYAFPIYSALCIGGGNMRGQIGELRRNPQVIVGTPGRLKDLIERRALNLSRTKTIVLDEVDRMLDMGFLKDVSFLISSLPVEKQTLFFCATIDRNVETLINKFLKNPVKMSLKVQETSSHVEQNVIHVASPVEKLQKLHEILSKEEYKKVLIFGRTKHGVEDLSQKLYAKGFRVGSIHGNKPQFKRQQVLRMFREDVIKILVATDVAARGLDIVDVTHVINYDVPDTYEDYVHRIGRTGRANKTGNALTFVLQKSI